MRVDYDQIDLSLEQIGTIARTIYRNKFIPIKPYREQLYACADTHKRKLIGGSAFSGKSLLGATLALQWFEVPDYRCLVVRRTYDDVIATGGIVDYIERWTSKFDEVVQNKSERVFHNTETDAKIFYNYMMYEDDKNKFKSRGYHVIIVDEASELLKVNLRFINRSLRYNNQKQIPLSLNYISNPANSSGIEYLNNKFVSKKGPYPYYEMNFWNNPYIDAEDYRETLSELSPADYQYQMGNWDYILQSGDIFSNDDIIKATITQEYYKLITERFELLRVIRGWDIAASDTKTSDYTASSLLEVYKDGPVIVKEQNSTKKKPGSLENWMKTIMDNDGEEVEQWIEKQPAGAGKIMNRYWKQEFSDYNTKFIPVFKNKVIRAGKLVPKLKKHELLFLEDPASPYINIFTKQAVNFPNFEKLTDEDDESRHDDRIDSISVVIQELFKKKPVLKPKSRRR